MPIGARTVTRPVPTNNPCDVPLACIAAAARLPVLVVSNDINTEMGRAVGADVGRLTPISRDEIEARNRSLNVGPFKDTLAYHLPPTATVEEIAGSPFMPGWAEAAHRRSLNLVGVEDFSTDVLDFLQDTLCLDGGPEFVLTATGKLCRNQCQHDSCTCSWTTIESLRTNVQHASRFAFVATFEEWQLPSSDGEGLYSLVDLLKATAYARCSLLPGANLPRLSFSEQIGYLGKSINPDVLCIFGDIKQEYGQSYAAKTGAIACAIGCLMGHNTLTVPVARRARNIALANRGITDRSM